MAPATFSTCRDSIITREGDLTKVNLCLTAASPYLDVDSYLPTEGRVVLKIKDTSRVAIRMPAWCQGQDLQWSINGIPSVPEVRGRYVQIANLRPGDRLEMTFPMPEKTVTHVIGDLPFTLTLRGANVVHIDPPGIAIPLYRKLPQGNLVEKTRFLPTVKPSIW